MFKSMKRKCLRNKKHSLLLQVLISITFISFLVLTIILEPTRTHYFTNTRLKIFGNEISCYRDHSLKTLPDILEELPESGNNIFFHETSCKSQIEGRIMINGRQACAVESAALLHPDRSVFLLFTSPGEIKPGFHNETYLALSALQSYQNVKLGHIDFAKYINNTPLEHLYTSGSIELSKYAISHASDVLRYLTLWKFGGIYLDLDVVVIKSFQDLGENFAGCESTRYVAAGVLGFGQSDMGHLWAGQCLEDLSTQFNGRNWGYNGPGVITRFLTRLCKTNETAKMVHCEGYKVMPRKIFYPIPWSNWTLYFNPRYTRTALKIIKNSYTIHVWNTYSYNTQVNKDSAYAKIAQQFCPKVYKLFSESNF